MTLSAALDTSCNTSLAVKRYQDILLHETLAVKGRQSDRDVVPWLLDKLEALGIQLSDIDKWSIGTGPGSYSGIRAGIALVRGICRGSGAHCRGVPSSRALARQFRVDFEEGSRLAVVHDGRRQQAIASVYRVQGRGVRLVSPPKILSQESLPEDLKGVQAVITPHAEELASLLDVIGDDLRVLTTESVDARELLFAGGAWPSEPAATEASLEPIYVRPPVFAAPKPLRSPEARH